MLLQFSRPAPQHGGSPGALSHGVSLAVLPIPLLTKAEKNTTFSADKD